MASVELPVPGSRSDGEDGGGSGEGVVLPRGASSLGGARCRGEALFHPIRQPDIQLQRGKAWI